MDLELVNADARIAEHRARTARGERRGPLLSISNSSAAWHRTTPTAVIAAGSLLRVIGAAVHWATGFAHDSRDSLRSNEHDLAALGIKWPADETYDAVLAAEALAAQQRRLTSQAITPPVPIRLVHSHDTGPDLQRRSTGGAFARAGGRLRLSPHSAAIGGIGQSRD